MKVFLIFYIVCVLLTGWFMVGGSSAKNKRSMPDVHRVASDKASDPNSFLEQESCMSKLLDRFRYFKQKGETFAEVTDR